MKNTTAPMATYPAYGAIITQLLKTNRGWRARARHMGIFEGMMPVHWYREYCTVQAGGARQTGMTRAIRRFIIKDHTVVICVNSMMKESFLLPFENPDFVVTATDVLKELKTPMADLQPKMHRRFIVDSASHVFERLPIKMFYQWVQMHAGLADPEIILLG